MDKAKGEGVPVFRSARTRMSSRGQIVIPKALREAAGISEGDEVEAVFDGHKLLMASVNRSDAPDGASSSQESGIVAETRARYQASDHLGAIRVQDPALRPSKVWADRVRAMAAIGDLSREFSGLDCEEIRRVSRRELEVRTKC